MAADVIIDPSTGQIYWNDGAGSPQSISIKGDAQDAISFVGYGAAFSPGSTPSGATSIVTFKDSATETLIPGTTGNELGSDVYRWKFYGTSGNFSNTLVVDGATLTGLGLTTTLPSFDFGNTSGIAQTLNFSNTTTGQVLFNFGTSSASASTATFFGSVNSNRLVLNVNSSGNVYVQTNQVNARVRLFQNNTTGNVSIFGLGGGTLYLGEDTTTNNNDIAIRGTVLSGGGGNVRAALFTLATATSNGSGVGGTIIFQTSTSGNPTANFSNTLRTRLRIEGAATGTSNFESIIGFGDTTSGTAWTSYLRGVDATGSNIEAGEIQIQAGRSTGSGLAQGISFYVSSSGAGAAVLNTPLQIGRFTGTGFTIYSTTVTSSTTTGALIVAGGVGIGGTLFTDAGKTSSISGFGFSNGAGTGNSIVLNSTAVTTSTTTGALIVAGGVGIGGTLFTDPSRRSSVSGFAISNGAGTGNSIILNSAAVTTSTTSGALIVAGGVGIGGTLFTDPSKKSSVSGFAISNGVGTGTSLILNSSALSNTTSSGALIISGGAGIAKSLNIGEGINLWNGANYTGLKSAASTSIQYTLPATVPSGTGTSFLSSSDTGVMAWVAAPTGGGGSPSGSVGDVQYNSGTGNFASTADFNWANSIGMLSIKGYNLSGTVAAATNAALLVGEAGSVSGWSGSATGTVLGLSNTSGDGIQYNFIDAQYYDGTNPTNLSVFKVDYLGRTRTADLTITKSAYATRTNNNTLTTSASQSVNITYVLPLALPSTGSIGSSVLSSDTSGNLIWAPMVAGSPGGSGTVNSGTAFSTAYYNADGTTVSGTGLLKIIPSGTAISSFADVDMRFGKSIRFWNATNNLYTGLQANNASSYSLTLPTAPVGNGYSTLVVDTSGNMYFVPMTGGLASTTATGNLPAFRMKQHHHIWFCSGYTPVVAGADSVVFRVPDSSEDGLTDVTFSLKEFDIRVETDSIGESRIQVEKSSTNTGAFTLASTGSSLVSGFGLTVSGSGIFVTHTTTFGAGIFVTSNDLLRLNWTLLNATHANFSVQLTLVEV